MLVLTEYFTADDIPDIYPVKQRFFFGTVLYLTGSTDSERRRYFFSVAVWQGSPMLNVV